MSVRILIVNPLWPHPAHSVRAANVVIFELIAQFARHSRLKVGFLKISDPDATEKTTAEEEGVRQLEALGVEFLDPFIYKPAPVLRSRVNRWLFPVEGDFYPEGEFRAAAEQAAAKFAPGVLFIPWSETATSLFADMKVRKFAYYGNPDPKAGRARAEFARAHDGDYLSYLNQRFRLGRLERFHLSIMRRYEFLGDVAKNDADYYVRSGHPNAFYVRNLWMDRLGQVWRERRAQTERTSPFVIVGNIGQLGATANTHGLEILGRDVLPELRRAMTGHAFEVHLYGAGEPHAGVADLLRASEFRRRGFVDDIDAELLAAPVFLCMNNASRYKVGHTRYLHAWSLGSCVVGHRDTALSMPEMVSDENCLLGGSAAEIADMVAAVAKDPALRRRLGEAGYATFKEKFTAAPVVEEILSHIEKSPSGSAVPVAVGLRY